MDDNKYRWQQITGTPQAYPVFSCQCFRCGERMQSDRQQSSMWADLNGPAFRAYYCGTCRSQIGYETGELELTT